MERLLSVIPASDLEKILREEHRIFDKQVADSRVLLKSSEKSDRRYGVTQLGKALAVKDEIDRIALEILLRCGIGINIRENPIPSETTSQDPAQPDKI